MTSLAAGSTGASLENHEESSVGQPPSTENSHGSKTPEDTTETVKAVSNESAMESLNQNGSSPKDVHGDNNGGTARDSFTASEVEEQKDTPAPISDDEKPQAKRESLSPSPALLPTEDVARLNYIRAKQGELAGHYFTLAGALAAALARRANLTLAKLDGANMYDPESTIVAEIHDSNTSLRPKKEKPLNLFKYQKEQIHSNGEINIGIIWRDFYKQKADLKWRMHEELIQKITRLEREKGLLSRVRSNPTPLEVISKNLDTIRDFKGDPGLQKLNEKSIKNDLKLLKRKLDDPDADSEDEAESSYDLSSSDQNVRALLYEPSAEQNSSLYSLAVAAQPPSNQLWDLLAVGNTELGQPHGFEALQQASAAPHLGPLPSKETKPRQARQEPQESYQSPHVQSDSRVSVLTQGADKPSLSPAMLPRDEHHPVRVDTQDLPKQGQAPQSRAELSPALSVHKRTPSQHQSTSKRPPSATNFRSPRHRKTNSGSRQSPPMKRAKVERSPSLHRQSSVPQQPHTAGIPAGGAQMVQPHMAPPSSQPGSQLQGQPMSMHLQGVHMNSQSPQHGGPGPQPMPSMSPMVQQQPQLPGNMQQPQMPYVQHPMLPPIYQNAQQMPPQVQMAPMQMQMPMHGYGMPGVYEAQQAGMQNMPMYPGAMPPMVPVYGDMYFQGQVMQQMASYPQYDDKGNPIYYSMAQVGPSWPNSN